MESQMNEMVKQHERGATKICSKCDTEKKLNEFPKKGRVCKICSRKYHAEYRKKNKELVNERIRKCRNTPEGKLKKQLADKEWRENNKEKHRATTMKWREENRDRVLSKMREYYQNNTQKFKEYREETREQRREYDREYAKKRYHSDPKFKEYRRALGNARKEMLLRQAPSWINFEDVYHAYMIAQRVTRETGIPHEVDHIVPISSSVVCGLHYFSNLRLVTRHENRVKSNKLVDDIV